MYIFSCLGHTCRSLQRSEGKILLIAIFEREGFNDRIYVQVHTHCDIVIIYIPGLHKLWQPCSRAARKWRENEEMKRKWRENEEMEREIHSQDFLILCLFPPSLSISYIKNCHILSQNVKYGTFVANVTKNLTYALWGNNSGSNTLRGSSASCAVLRDAYFPATRSTNQRHFYWDTLYGEPVVTCDILGIPVSPVFPSPEYILQASKQENCLCLCVNVSAYQDVEPIVRWQSRSLFLLATAAAQ